MRIHFTVVVKKEALVRMECFVGPTLMMKLVETVLLMNVWNMPKRMNRMPFLTPPLRIDYVDCATKRTFPRETFFGIGDYTLKVRKNKTILRYAKMAYWKYSLK